MLYPNGHHGHNVNFLVYSMNLDGRYQDSVKWARSLLNDFKETPRERGTNNQRTSWRQGYFSLIRSLVRFEKWDLIQDGTTIPMYDRPEQMAWKLWAAGLAQAANGQLDKARATARDLEEQAKKGDGSRRPLQSR